MSILEEYPKSPRHAVAQLRKLLERIPGSEPKDREDVAQAINGVADKARDLDEIFHRLTQGPLDDNELADLLIAFELTVEALRGYSGSIIDGILFEYGDCLRPEAS